MSLIFQLASYDRATDEQVGTREVGPEWLVALQRLLGESFDPHQDVYPLEGEVAAELERRFGIRLDPHFAHYLEQFSV